MAQKNYIGYFFKNKIDLWNEVKNTLQKFQKSIYIVDEHTITEIKSNLNFVETQTNLLEIISIHEVFLREQVVRAKPVIEAFADKIKASSSNDLVIFLEMTWAVRTPSGDIYLRELHEAFQLFIEKNPITIICLYNESILLDEQLMLSLNSHPLIFTSNGNVENPYYLPVDLPKVATKHIIGLTESYSAVPWFWTNQYHLKLQMAGISTGFDKYAVRGEMEGGKFSVYYYQSDKLIAVDSLNKPAEHLNARKLISAGTSPKVEDIVNSEIKLDSFLEKAN